MVTTFSLIIVGLAVIMVTSTVIQFHRRKITASWAMFWSGLWVVGATLTFFTGLLDRLAETYVGVDGTRFLMVAAILFLLFVSYRTFLRQKSLEAEISRLVEAIAKKDAKKGTRK